MTQEHPDYAKEWLRQHFRPRAGKLPAAVRYSGRSRSTLYEWAAKYPGLFRKDGKSTIVDFDMIDRIVDQLPAAKIKTA